MNKLITVAFNDLRLSFRENGVWINLVLLPVAFIFLIGLVNGAFTDSEDPKLLLDVFNADVTEDGVASDLSTQYLDILRESNSNVVLCPMDNDRFAGDICGLDDVETLDDETAQERVQNGVTVAILEIPADFEAMVLAGEPVTIVYRSDEDPLQPSFMLQVVQSATQRVAGAATASVVGGDVFAGIADDDAEIESFRRDVYDAASVTWSDLPQTVSYRLSSEAVGTITVEQTMTDSTYTVDAPRLRVDVIDLDGTFAAEQLVDRLQGAGWAVCPAEGDADICGDGDIDAESAQARLESGAIAGVITIPDGFEGTLAGGGDVTITVQTAADMDLQATVENAAARVDPEQSETSAPGFQQSVPGMGTMFVMFTVLAGSALLIRERKRWTLQRLIAMPVSRAQIIGGKILARFTLGIIQFIVAFGVGFALGVSFGDNPLALLLVMVAFTFCTAAIGLLMATFVENEEQASGIITFFVLTMAPLGGAWWPLEIVPDFMQTIAYISPIAWAMDAFNEVIFFDGGIPDVLLQCGVLFAAGFVLFGFAITRFRYE